MACGVGEGCRLVSQHPRPHPWPVWDLSTASGFSSDAPRPTDAITRGPWGAATRRPLPPILL